MEEGVEATNRSRIRKIQFQLDVLVDEIKQLREGIEEE